MTDETNSELVRRYKAGERIDIRAKNIQGKWTPVMGSDHAFDFSRYGYRLDTHGCSK